MPTASIIRLGRFRWASIALAVGVACSAGENAAGRRSGGAGAAGGDGGSGGFGALSGSTGGTIATGGSVATGGSSGAGAVAGLPGDGCTGFSQQAENKLQPADIVIAVDQSGSMDDETGFVQQQINNFASQVAASGIDTRVILIAERPSGSDLPIAGCQTSPPENPICVPVPLGGANCGDNLPRYQSVNCHVDSHDAFAKILATFDVYKNNLRRDAFKHFVVITDDESDLPAAQFDSSIRTALTGAGLVDRYRFHAIFAYADDPGDFLCLATPQPCCGIAAGEGAIYRQLVQTTGGVMGDLCLQQAEFQKVWTEVQNQVLVSATIACEWDIPPPPEGQQLNPNEVNVQYTGGGQQKLLGYVASSADCQNYQDAWYYDNPPAPTKVIACPDVCQEIQSGQAQRVDVIFNCQTVLPVPS